ncbi:NRPS condensation-like uncharacterized protein/uncharacterized membrane protein YdjX (TVP38/TMEM64 family) [Lachnospiraceae bacterium PF1-22]|uniref:VTT domain-containing protein n=1 Tax=Ohessyouella blattaphilus TaxID=2949333 RepID=UPI003E22AFA5
MNKKSYRQVVLFCFTFAALVFMATIILLPYFQKLSEPENQAAIENWINKKGSAGVLIILALQVLQVVIAFIPGEPVELLAGALYESVGGLVICLVGTIFASTIIFSLSKRFGKKLLHRFFSKEKVDSWTWLQDSKKSELVTFILFFIPGTPKDMLTYFVGVTEMRVRKFICITTIARLPSVLSSTIIGSTMRQGKWEISLIVFLVTGILGIVGISTKQRVVNFCRNKTKSEQADKVTKCESLDFVEATHSDRLCPFMQCHMEFEGSLDIERLTKAISQSTRYVPEVLYTFDFKRERFIDRDISADRALVTDSIDMNNAYSIDLSQNPQLQIIADTGEQPNTVIFIMSHILTDAVGFLQYLYLLALLYNEEPLNRSLRNFRNITPILENIHVQPQTEQTKQGKRAIVSPLRPYSNGKTHYCLKSSIASDDFEQIHNKAKQHGATLNDVFIAAFARVIARLQSIDKVVLPCPADLRRFKPVGNDLTVANMTGIYKRITIEVGPEDKFSSTLMQTHIEVELQKSRYRCFAGIQPLDFSFHKVPRPILKKAIKAFYRILPVTCTNVGVINDDKLNFKGSTVKSCFMTGAYRQSPDFQLTVSTFRNICTLNCTLIGDENDEKIGQDILNQIKQELLKWTRE